MILDSLIGIFSLIINIVETTGYFGIFFGMAIESSFIPFPSELVLIPAGYLISQGKMSLPIVFLASLLGSLIGAFINYSIAFFLGRRATEAMIMRYGKFFFLGEDQIRRADNFFIKHGEITTLVGRLIPLVRQFISLPAGFAKMNLKKFTFFTALGSGVWALILIAIGYLFGNNQDLIKANLSTVTYMIVALVIVIVLAYVYIKKKYPKKN